MRQKSFLPNIDICGLVPVVSKRVTGQRGCGVAALIAVTTQQTRRPVALQELFVLLTALLTVLLLLPVRRDNQVSQQTGVERLLTLTSLEICYWSQMWVYPLYQHHSTPVQCCSVCSVCSVWMSELPRPPRLLTVLPLPALPLIANTTTASPVPTSWVSTSSAHLI